VIREKGGTKGGLGEEGVYGMEKGREGKGREGRNETMSDGVDDRRIVV